MVKKRGLGTSLEALLAYAQTPMMASPDEQSTPAPATIAMQTPSPSAPVDTTQLMHIPLHHIERSPYQPRQAIATESLEELARSIKTQGVIQPIVVRQYQDKYEIIAGERRVRAAKIAGLTTIPAVIRTLSDHQAMAIALIENIQREALNPVETAEAFQKLIDTLQLTHQQLADTIGKSRTHITNHLRLLSLPTEIRTMVLNNQLEMGHARSLIGLPETTQLTLAHKIIAQALSVREAEILVQQHMRLDKLRTSSSARTTVSPTRLEEQLSHLFKGKIKIKTYANGSGKITIYCQQLKELEQLLTTLQYSATPLLKTT